MRIIDLTKTIESGMEVYPGDPEVQITKVHNYDKEGWRLSLLSFGSHTGTHVDAFSHMNPKGKNLEELKLSAFIAEAQIVSLKRFLPQRTGLVFRNEIISLKDIETIIKAKPKFVAIGDAADFSEVEVERKLLKANILTFTNLINLNKLPVNKKFTFFGIPLKFKDSDGSPIRAFAIL